jgi:hypothetical protein
MSLSLLPTLAVVLFSSCASSGDWHQGQAAESVEAWRTALDQYLQTEDEFLALLFNLERMPDDPFLRGEYERLRVVLENQRMALLEKEAEKRGSVIAWETSIVESQQELKEIRRRQDEAEERLRQQQAKPKSQLQQME